MEYVFKSTFGEKLHRAIIATGIGQLISVQNSDFGDLITIDIGPLKIPQYPINAVADVERVSILAIDDDIPAVYCRADFPVVPHLNIGNDGTKSLCLFDVSFEEIRYSFNASMFLHRIVYWFEQTARGELHQADQPLEPFFSCVRDTIVLDTSNSCPFIRLQKTDTLYGHLYQEIPLDTNLGNVYAVLGVNICKIFSENIIHKMPTTLGELDEAFDETIETILWQAIPEIWGVKQNQRWYKLLFHQEETKLRRSSVLLIVRVSLARTKDASPERIYFKAFQVSEDFQRLCCAFGYEIKNGRLTFKAKKETYKDILIKPFEVLAAFDRNSASRFNDVHTSGRNGQYVQIGVGALGSQVADNCIRSGYGRWIYIDPDILYPHNLARHRLGQNSIGKSKALEMQAYANALYSSKEPIVENAIVASAFDINHRELIKGTIQSAELVVDCSASVAVGRYLANKLAGNTRSISLFMNPSGNALIVLLESKDRIVSLDTLEMQYYRMLIRNPALRGHLKSEQRILYSATCRGTSLVYPRDNVSIFSGLCSKVIKNVGSSSTASIIVWEFDDLNLRKYEEKGEQFQQMICNDWLVKISPTLIARLYLLRQKKLPNETGGPLVGAYDFANNICYIVDAIDSPSDSQEYPNAYIRGSNNLPQQVESIRESTIDNLTYIGEWHSHPTNCTRPSSDDQILLKSISNYMITQSSPACMMIVGESQFSIYIDDSGCN